MVDHNKLNLNHVPYTGTFDDAAERIAAADLTVEDIGKQYLQLDDNSLWQLLSESPSPGWKGVGNFDSAMHAAQVAPCIHPPIKLQYLTQSDRENGINEVNGIVMSVAQIGQWCEQLDNHTFYKLVQLSPITWKQVNLTYEETIADMEIYIDFTSGNDDTGNGSVGSPWKTFTRAFRDIQHLQIKHVIKIFPTAGTYTDFPSYLDLHLLPCGRVIIDGSKNTYPIYAGPYTIDSFAGVGPATVGGYELATDVNTSPGLTGDPDEFYGKFMHFTSGNYAGQILPIAQSRIFGPNQIRTMIDRYGFANGNAFNVVDCPVKIDVSHGIVIVNSSSKKYISQANCVNFAVAAVEIKSGSDSDSSITALYLENLNVNFSFANIVDRYDVNDSGVPLTLHDVKLNYDTVSGSFYDDDNLEDWYTATFNILARNGEPVLANGFDAIILNNVWGNWISKLFCRRRITLAATSMGFSSCYLGGISNRPGTISGYTKTTIIADNVFVYQKDFSHTVLELSNAHFICDALYIGAGGAPVTMYNNCFFRSKWFHGNNTYAVAITLGWCSKFHIDYPSSRTTIDGTVGFATWEFDGSLLSVKPSEGAFVQKAGGFVVSQAGGGG